MLTAIWQRVLERPLMGVDDNFFDIDGNVRSAGMLFAEVAQEYGRELPSATIDHATKIAVLTCWLEQPTLPRFSPFVQMKAGHEKPRFWLLRDWKPARGFSNSQSRFERACDLWHSGPGHRWPSRCSPRTWTPATSPADSITRVESSFSRRFGGYILAALDCAPQ
jgi:Phosphopantetheine attachment site